MCWSRICSALPTLEKVDAEPEALRIIARAAEGSVRDSLSLFDQAIAHAAGVVRADDVRQMLGLADRARIIDLFGALASGNIESAFREFRDQYNTGADPAVVLSDLAEFVNFVTRVKIVPATADSNALSETERLRGRDFAAKLSMRVLSRMWQMLLKGITEVKDASRPAAAAEMVMVRIAYAADLPTPDEVIRSLDGAPAAAARGVAAPRAEPQTVARSEAAMPASAPRMPSSGAEAAMRQPMPASSSVPQPQAVPTIRLATFADLVALAAEKRDLPIKTALENDVRLVRIEDGRLEIALEPQAQRSLAQELSRKLEQWTGRRWAIAVSNAAGQPTLRAQAQAQKNELETAVQADPRVQAVFETWPGAKIENVRRTVRPQADADLPLPDPLDDDDDL